MDSGSISADNAFDYFSLSPFYGRKCNNELLIPLLTNTNDSNNTRWKYIDISIYDGLSTLCGIDYRM